MSYYKTEMIGATCDNCKEDYYDDYNGWAVFPDESACHEYIDDSGWHETNDGNHYCPKCFEFDEEDNLIIKTPNQ